MKRPGLNRQEAGISLDRFRRLAAVAHASELSFLELVGLAELDPARDFRGARIRGADLRGQDLSGFDLTGAVLIDCQLAGCDLTHAIGVTQGTIVRPRDGAMPHLPVGVRGRFLPFFTVPATDRKMPGQQMRWIPGRFWPDSDPPSWARDWGRDEYGNWADFTVPAAGGIMLTQRMRWIPEGELLIGSPKDEYGRFDDEGPQKLIQIAEGFWLFDTPCTQALWLAVMGGNNPSRFLSTDRPVDSVHFSQVCDFIRQLNRMEPGLMLSLPSEAQWEYACRARTTDATYDGPLKIAATNDAPVLDPIAWYVGNCDQDFELKFGQLISGLGERPYDGLRRGGTHPVGRKRPNHWGLHDMLGNVWEWCADEWHDSHRLTPENGTPYRDGRIRGAVERVIRGGSWNDDARYARAACRNADSPALQDGHLGFRCVRVREVNGATDKLSETGHGERRSGATGGRGRARSAPERPAGS
jgi:formylglycine-generating enzyme required for sulfatase activity